MTKTARTSVKSVYIGAPVERVFRFVADVTNWRSLTPWWVAVTYEPVDMAADGTGTLSYRGKAFRVIEDSGTAEVTEVVPNSRVVLRDDDPLQGTYTFLFEPVGAGTTATVVNEREPARAERLPVLGSAVGWMLDQHDDQVLRKLKAMMERDRPV